MGQLPKLFDSQGLDILRHLMIRVSQKLEDTLWTYSPDRNSRGGCNLRILGNLPQIKPFLNINSPVKEKKEIDEKVHLF